MFNRKNKCFIFVMLIVILTVLTCSCTARKPEDSSKNKLKGLDEKIEKLESYLHELEDQGLVDKGSIYCGDEMVSYSVCGLPHTNMLVPFNDGMRSEGDDLGFELMN